MPLNSELSYRQFTSSDGLPSDELHCVVQADDGVIWLASDHGLCAYDGYNFKTYTTSDGLSDNTIFWIEPDELGGLWLTTFSGGLCYYRDGILREAPANSELRERLGDSYISGVKLDGLTNIWLAIKDGRVFKLDLRSATLEQIEIVKRESPTQTELVELEFGGLLSIMSNDVFDDPTRKPQIERTDYGWVAKSWSRASFNFAQKMFNSDILWFDANSAAHISGDTVKAMYSFPEVVSGVLELGDAFTWISTFAGVVEFKGMDFSVPHKRYLKNHVITGMCRDHEGNIWLTTLRNGLLMIATRNVLQLQSPFYDGEVVACTGRNDTLVLANTKNKIAILPIRDSADIEPEIFNLDVFNRTIKSTPPFVAFLDNVIHTGLSYLELDTRKVKRENSKLNGHWPLNAAVAANGEHLYCGHGILRKAQGEFHFVSSEMGFSERTLCIHGDRQGRVHAGTHKGLLQHINGQLILPKMQDSLLQTRVNDIAEAADGTLWLASKGGGVISMATDGTFQSFTVADGLHSDLCSSILIDESTQDVWVAGSGGLSCLRAKPHSDSAAPDGAMDPGEFEIERFSGADGLPRGQIVDMVLVDGKLFVVSRKGVYYFDPHQMLGNICAPITRIDNLRQSGKVLPRQHESYVLTADSNDLEINFTAHSFRRESGPTYRYRLHGYDAGEIQTLNRSVRYTDLPAGDYTFELAASNERGVWGMAPAKLNISVERHFTEEVWFRVLGTLGLGTLLALAVFAFMRRQQKIEASRRHMVDVEYRSLRLQMNPHFLFNALNSVQYLIVTRKTHDAGVYLTQFSRLIRTILDHSKRRTVFLEAEIKSVNYYMALEKLRFKGKLDYAVHVSEELNSGELYIAPMLLQPLLENAVLHGIMPRDTPGVVSLSVIPQSQGFACVVQDNGIGRVRARELKKANDPLRPSTALSNIAERISLANALGSTRYNLSLEDLYDEFGLAAGTKATITVEYRN